MPSHALTDLDPTNRVLKRAQYEAFAFSLLDGDVVVRNDSHPNPADHEYRVHIDDGVPVNCECPADEYEGPCKHRVAVAIRTRILELAVQMRDVANTGRPDGEQIDTQAADSSPPQCDCDSLPGDFPCWECVRTNRRELPE